MASNIVAATGTFTSKPGRENDCLKLVTDMFKSTRAEDEGCICYYFHQKTNSPREFVFYERWRDIDALRSHVKRLVAVYGPPPEGTRGLPAAILEPFEKSEMTSLSVLE